MPDDTMDIEENKENIPSSDFSYSKLSARIFNMLPVYFNRKRRRSSEDSNDVAASNGKKTKIASEYNQCSNIVTRLLLTLPYTRSDQDKNNQYSEYLEYMSQRESFD